jgi:hypothetical protein
MLFLKGELVLDNPVLLQTLYTNYMSVLREKLSEFSETDISSHQKSLDWLKQQIRRCLGGSVIFSTIKGQCRFGTMIRRCGSDVIETLHRLVFNQQRLLSDRSHEQVAYVPTEENQLSMEYKLMQVADYLNKCINKHAALVTARFNREQLTFDSIDFENYVTSLPPHLWNFIFRLTVGNLYNSFPFALLSLIGLMQLYQYTCSMSII